MPLPIPELDDRTYTDLVAEALERVPLGSPGWTDRSPGDPGVALVELLAWLTEMMIFRLDQVTDEHTRRFLALLDGPGTAGPGADLGAAVRTSLRTLRAPHRAVTADDYEYLARAAAVPPPRRVHCLPRWDPAARAPAEGHVTVFLVTGAPPAPPDPDVVATVSARLRERRLLGTRHHVAGPGWVDVTVTATLAFRDDAEPDATLDAAAARVRAHLDPLPADGRPGWPLGHPVHATGIEAVLDDVDGVDYVEGVTVSRGAGAGTTVTLAPDELVGSVRAVLVGYDTAGVRHPPEPPTASTPAGRSS